MARKILIVDDNEDMLNILQETLNIDGHNVECLTFTEDICKSVKEIKPDLVILDYILSGINGGELCHQVKTDPETSHIPVVMISAYPRVLGSLGDYGADVLISKPVDLNDVSASVKELLEGIATDKA